jgi:hypothetical protein
VRVSRYRCRANPHTVSVSVPAALGNTGSEAWPGTAARKAEHRPPLLRWRQLTSFTDGARIGPEWPYGRSDRYIRCSGPALERGARTRHAAGAPCRAARRSTVRDRCRARLCSRFADLGKRSGRGHRNPAGTFGDRLRGGEAGRGRVPDRARRPRALGSPPLRRYWPRHRFPANGTARADGRGSVLLRADRRPAQPQDGPVLRGRDSAGCPAHDPYPERHSPVCRGRHRRGRRLHGGTRGGGGMGVALAPPRACTPGDGRHHGTLHGRPRGEHRSGPILLSLVNVPGARPAATAGRPAGLRRSRAPPRTPWRPRRPGRR